MRANCSSPKPIPRALVTVTLAEADCPLETVAVMVVLPEATPVTRQPPLSTDTDAIAIIALVQVESVGGVPPLPVEIDTVNVADAP
jgi:hypothetical protein